MAVCFYFYPLLDERYKSVIILLNIGEYLRFLLNKCLFFRFLIKIYLLCIVFCLHVSLKARRGSQISLQMVVSHNVVAGN